MKKAITLLTILLSFLTCVAQSFQVGKWNTFVGEVGGRNLNISVFIFKDSTVKGNYFIYGDKYKIELAGQWQTLRYADIQDKKAIVLRGVKVKILLFENGDNDKYINCEFTEQVETVDVPINCKLKIIDGSSGTFKHRYSAFLQADSTIEKFAVKVIDAIIKNNISWLAGVFYYPALCQEGDGEFVNIRSPQQFNRDYNLIFTTSFKRSIKSAGVFNMYTNFTGVSIGDERNYYITFLSVKNPATKKEELKITSIMHD